MGFAGAPASLAAPARPALAANIARRVSSFVIGILLSRSPDRNFRSRCKGIISGFPVFPADHAIIHPIAEIRSLASLSIINVGGHASVVGGRVAVTLLDIGWRQE